MSVTGALIWKEWRQVGEPPAILGLFRVESVDGDRPHERRKFLLGTSWPDGTGNDVALAKPRLAHDVGGYVNVFVSRQIAGAAKKPVTLRQDVEDTFTGLEVGFVDGFLLAPAPPPAVAVASLAIILLTVFMVAWLGARTVV